MSRALRTGVVGVGRHCQRNILPATQFVPLELVAFCDVDLSRAYDVATAHGVNAVYPSLREMLAAERLDAVLLVVGPHEHPRLAREALQAGLHVWMEKPPGVRASDVVEIMKAQEDRAVVVGVKKAFMPATRKTVELFESDAAGQLGAMMAVYPLEIPSDGERVLAERRETPSLNLCHPLAAITAVCGRVAAVTAHRARHGAVCVLEFESGAVGSLNLPWEAPASQPVERYEFYGDGCLVSIENGLRVRFQRAIPFDYARTTTYAPPGIDHGAVVWEPQNMLATLENQPLFTQGIVGSLDHFSTCVLRQQPASLGNTASALHLMEIYEAILLSAGNRVPVSPGHDGL